MYENETISFKGWDIQDSQNNVVAISNSAGNIFFRPKYVGVYIVRPCLTLINVLSCAAAAQCIITPIPKTLCINKQLVVYIKVYTRTGESKNVGNDNITAHNIRGKCTIEIEDLGTGIYKCAIKPLTHGVLDICFKVNNEHIGNIYHIDVLKVRRRWCCCL